MSPIPRPPLTFAAGTLDRAGQHRSDPAWQAAAREDPNARVVVVGPDALTDVPAPAGSDAIFLGLDGDRPVFARFDGESAAQAVVLQARPGSAITRGDDEAALFAYAAALLAWHRSCLFCGRCGEPTEVSEAGFVRRCGNGHAHHPRTDPAIIVLVVDRRGDRVLLGRQGWWPPRRYSTLAGFVEPGETLERAVAREVDEEAGVQAAEIRYVASQPWPFPGNLMLGFEATWAGGEAHVADRELEDVRWYTRAEIETAAANDEAWPADDSTEPDAISPPGGQVLLPPRLTIARMLIEGWLAAEPA
jgi:NAD+ diphosphatase